MSEFILHERPPDWTWVFASLGCVGGSVIGAIFWGPSYVFFISGLGLAATFWGLRMRIKDPEVSPSFAIVVLSLVVHGLLILVGFGLRAFFLAPLNEASLKLPALTRLYVHPTGAFLIKGPKNWIYEPLTSPQEAALRLRPAGQENYMGVSEVKIFLKKLSSPPPSKESYLEKIATWSARTDGRTVKKKLFTFHTESVNLLKGGKGITAVMDVKKFWIPLRQVTLFGIKNDRTLLSVSAMGLKSHSTLSSVLCLGLYEKTAVLDAKKQY